MALNQNSATVSLDGHRVKKIREERGLTQLYVATVVGVTTDTISRWENKRYPSIKRENAIKLAETLGVSLEDILEKKVREENQEKNIENKDIPESEIRKRPWSWKSLSLLVAGFILGALLGSYIFYSQTKGELSISAQRILPERCWPYTKFPVVLNISIHPRTNTALLVSEDIPRSLLITKAVPKSSSKRPGKLKWLYQGEVGRKKFVYICQLKKSTKKKVLRFRGKITIKSNQAISIETSGDSHLLIDKCHWADKNCNRQIEDEEILDAYDLLSGVSGVRDILEQVEELWSKGGYHFDKKIGRFLPGSEIKGKGDLK